MTAVICVVDDDGDHLAAICDLVTAAGYQAQGFPSAAAFLARPEGTADLLLTDLRMPGMDGMALLRAVRGRGGDLPVIMLTGHGDVGHAVTAIREGAEDFLEKPYESGQLLAVLHRALAARQTRHEVARLQQVLAQGTRQDILGQSRALRQVRERIAALAPIDLDVVILGETGTGKELAARALHAQSPRAGGPFVALNCAAVPEAMAETILFGHVAGAVAHDPAGRIGKLDAAQGGTLMLDEVEALPPAVQAKLLRVLQERQVERIGETAPRALDIRVIATTKTDLRLVEGFRADLYFRLAGTVLTMPTLREAGEDMPLLFVHYAQLAARRYGRADPDVPWALRQQLKKRGWPGNIRELKAAAVVHALGLTDGLAAETAPPGKATLAERVAEFEAREIALVLERHRGNTLRAAETLGLPRRTLNDKMRRYGLGEAEG